MKNRIIAAFIALIILLVCTTSSFSASYVGESAEDTQTATQAGDESVFFEQTDTRTVYSGTCGTDLTWTLDTDSGVLTIEGSGEMFYGTGYSSSYAPWHQYRETIRSVSFPDGLLSIYTSAFEDCTNLEAVVLPEGVLTLYPSAFSGCSSLISVSLPESLLYINQNAFSGCSSLTSLFIPAAVEFIGGGAFSGCSSLETIAVGEGNAWFYVANGMLISIEYNSVICCPAKTEGEVVIPEGVMEISNGAFSSCSMLTSVTMPDSLVRIGDSAFFGCSGLTSLVIPNGVNYIGTMAFSECSGLASVSLPQSLTSIRNKTFQGCSSLLSLAIPQGVTSIGDYAFDGCSSLVSVSIPDTVTQIGSCAFLYCSSLESVDIPYGTTSIGSFAFQYCTSLESVSFPESMANIGRYAFSGCSSLVSLTIPGSVSVIEQNTFENCSSLRSLVLLDGVTEIGTSAFENCTSLTSVALPESLETIRGYAFSGCYFLTSVAFPESMMSIGVGSFCGCSSLTSVIIPDGITELGYRTFARCTDLVSVTLPETLTRIGDFAFYLCPSLTSLDIPGSVVSIGKNAFYQCESLEAVEIPDSVTSIGERAFAYCNSVRSVTVGRGVTELGAACFYSNSPLYNVFFLGAPPLSAGSNLFWWDYNGVLYYSDDHASEWAPNGETEWNGYRIRPLSQLITEFCGELGNGVFWTLDLLTGDLVISGDGEMPDFNTVNSLDHEHKAPWIEFNKVIRRITVCPGITRIGKGAFEYCIYAESVSLPAGLLSIGEYAFYNCSSLTGLTLPDGINSIEYCAFAGCGSLDSIVIPESLETLYSGAFGSDSITEILFLGAPPANVSEYVHPFHNGSVVFYMPEHADEWAPNGETEWFGYQIVPYGESVPLLPYTVQMTYNFGNYQMFYMGLLSIGIPIRSHMYSNGDDTITRVEYTGTAVAVEVYDSSRSFVSGRFLEIELPIFGGFFSGENYNYLFFGQNNDYEDDRVEVVRIVKYTKDWQRVGSASIFGANTIHPFDGGSLRADEYNGFLFVRTCHQMYMTADGHQHQASFSFIIEEQSLAVTNCAYLISVGGAYVSHSNNQFIIVDDGTLLTLDLGDAYPRSAVLARFDGVACANTLFNNYSRVNTIIYPGGEDGDATPYSSLGGLEATSFGYMTVGCFSDATIQHDQSNVYLTVTDRNNFTDEGTDIVWLTSYDHDAGIDIGTPFLVKITNDRLLIMWKENADVKFVFVNGRGELLSEIRTNSALMLSDCCPIVVGDMIEWYVTNESAPQFFAIPVSGFLRGDADGNFVVDATDALMLLRAGIGLIDVSQQMLDTCDINGDGVINATDALMVLRAVLGIAAL